MAINKLRGKEIFLWLQRSPTLQDIFYIYSQAENKNSVLTPMGSILKEEIETQFLVGADCYLDYELAVFLDMVNIPNSVENLDYEQFFIDIANWIDLQDINSNYPFEGAERLEILDSGSLAALDENKAKYTLIFRIYFHKE